MKFKLADKIIDNTPYTIEIYTKSKGIEVTEKHFYNVFRKAKYYCNKTDSSCLFVYSSHSTHGLNEVEAITYIHNGKVGRPKRQISGVQETTHIHNMIVGRRAKFTAELISKAINKTFGLNISKVVSIKNPQDYTRYCFKQADIFRTCGDFDFKEYEFA